MMDKYCVSNNKIKSTLTGKEYSLEKVCFLLNQLDREAKISQRDLIRSIELKAVNRHLRMENRFLTIKLQQLAYVGMVNIKEIEKEISTLCLDPDNASEYIHSFEKENFELKQKLRELGKYSGDLL